MELPGEPIAELTKLNWLILSIGKENACLLKRLCMIIVDNLCNLDCLSIEMKYKKNRKFVYGEFRK